MRACRDNSSPHEAGRVGVDLRYRGGATAHQAIMQALYAREKSGRGRVIELSLFHALGLDERALSAASLRRQSDQASATPSDDRSLRCLSCVMVA